MSDINYDNETIKKIIITNIIKQVTLLLILFIIDAVAIKANFYIHNCNTQPTTCQSRAFLSNLITDQSPQKDLQLNGKFVVHKLQ